MLDANALESRRHIHRLGSQAEGETQHGGGKNAKHHFVRGPEQQRVKVKVESGTACGSLAQIFKTQRRRERRGI